MKPSATDLTSAEVTMRQIITIDDIGRPKLLLDSLEIKNLLILIASHWDEYSINQPQYQDLISVIYQDFVFQMLTSKHFEYDELHLLTICGYQEFLFN